MRFTASALEYLAGSESEVLSLVTDVYAVSCNWECRHREERWRSWSGVLLFEGAADLAQTLISSLWRAASGGEHSRKYLLLSRPFPSSIVRERSIPEGVQAEARSSIKDEMLIKALEIFWPVCTGNGMVSISSNYSALMDLKFFYQSVGWQWDISGIHSFTKPLCRV